MPHVELVLVTPDMAEQYLATMGGAQRKLKRHVVAAYAADMVAGRWALDAAAIAFDTKGRLVNGQHRMQAVALSGCSIVFAVMRDVPDDAILTMDSGARRTSGDQLHILGVPDGNRTATIVRAVLMYRFAPDRVWDTRLVAAVATRTAQFEYVMRHRAAVADALTAARAMRLGQAHLPSTGALHLLVHQDSGYADRWASFHDGLSTGVGLPPRDPRLAIRNHFARGRRRSGPSMTQAHLHVMIRGWNKYVRGESWSVVRMPGQSALPMPAVE